MCYYRARVNTRPNLTQGSEKNIKNFVFLFFPSPFVRLRLSIALGEIFFKFFYTPMKNSFEAREKIPEISAEILKNIESEAMNEPLEWRRFSIADINYALRTSSSKTSSGEINGQPAEYHQQHERNEWAIYIWEDLMEKVQRVLLFHEITEVYFRVKFGMEKTHAHKATLPYEEQFKKELISGDEEKVLQELRSQYKTK